MSKSVDYIELVTEAQFGDKDCLERLAELATVRLRAHVYRLTLRDDVTQDIVQESVLEMVKILGKLKRPDRFWPWLYGIALNKLRRYRRSESRHKATDISEVGFGGAGEDKQEALEKLLAEELRQAVSTAMGGVKPRHRAVLSMRCYDEMSYAQIAEAMGCSEFGAQMLFHRAKKSLGKQLARNGLSKGSLLTALVIFGKMTAANEAAAAEIAVSAAMVNVGLTATVAAVAASKTAVTTLAAASVVTAGALLMTPEGNEANIDDVRGHDAKGTIVQPVPEREDLGENWYFFPQGATGAVMTRRMRGVDEEGETYCEVLENEHANYFYDHRADTVYIRNRRDFAKDMSVRRLPTDAPRLRAMLDDVEGYLTKAGSAQYVSTRKKGLLVIANQSEGISRDDRHENLLREEYFQFAWPENTHQIDQRDAMHKRGWTYFRVEGQLGDRRVCGRGRIPFVYESAVQNGGWIELDIGEEKRISRGVLMRGLSRPWMGMHTIDTVRRDAARSRMRFETEIAEDGETAEVTLSSYKGRLVYSIDMEKDVVEKIDIVTGDMRGQLVFSYLQEIDGVEREFAKPRVQSGSSATGDVNWLFELGN